MAEVALYSQKKHAVAYKSLDLGESELLGAKRGQPG